MLGAVAYALAGLLDRRMQDCQRRVLGDAAELKPAELDRLPLVRLTHD
jgi:hypothetical protein